MPDSILPSPAVMGILNVTPDSFYDGGKFDAVDRAAAQTLKMIEEGADIIDIGGESTGPGSGDVSVEEELQRVLPVLERVGAGAQISVDTYKAEVARAALDTGAIMINDVTAGRGDPAMLRTIAERGCLYIIMRSKDATPRTTTDETSYDNVMKTIHKFFEERIEAAKNAGVKRERIILDPGLGHFISSDPQYSWHVLEHLEFLKDFGCPILVSPSRKSFTAEYGEQSPGERLPGTLKATRIALKHGADIIRTHDVRETKSLIQPLPLSAPPQIS